MSLSFESSMANQNTVTKVLEHCQVSPPAASVPSTSIPLSFFDIPLLLSRPAQRIFFYEYPHPTSHFMQHILPSLKHSLSLALQHFFPFAATLICPPQPHKPHILYLDGDSVPFTVVESTANFARLIADTPREVRDLHPFVPEFPETRTLENGARLVPLMAIQITVLSNSGFSICVNFNHVVADGKALHHFMKSWASLCRTKGDLTCLEGSVPFHDRAIIEDSNGLELCFLKEWWNWPLEQKNETELSDKVRATFVLSREQVEKLRKWVSGKCTSNELEALRMSTFVVTCSLIWVCLMKSEETRAGESPTNAQLCYLSFPADCRNRMQFPIPSTYFGNCLISQSAALERSVLVGENGIAEAAKAIGNKVRESESGVLRAAERWISNYREFRNQGHRRVTVAGSTQLGVYETDFGWGRPKKSEVVHIDVTGSFSLSDCRDKECAVEVGLALTRIQMDDFSTILQNTLQIIT